MTSNKPHSSEPVVIEERDSFGNRVFRFTDPWLRYFDTLEGVELAGIQDSVTTLQTDVSAIDTTRLETDIATAQEAAEIAQKLAAQLMQTKTNPKTVLAVSTLVASCGQVIYGEIEF